MPRHWPRRGPPWPAASGGMRIAATPLPRNGLRLLPSALTRLRCSLHRPHPRSCPGPAPLAHAWGIPQHDRPCSSGLRPRPRHHVKANGQPRQRREVGKARMINASEAPTHWCLLVCIRIPRHRGAHTSQSGSRNKAFVRCTRSGQVALRAAAHDGSPLDSLRTLAHAPRCLGASAAGGLVHEGHEGARISPNGQMSAP